MQRRIKVDTRGEGKDHLTLSRFKELEEIFAPRLEYMKIKKGYVMSTNLDKYKDHVHSIHPE